MNNDSAEPSLQEIDDFYDGLRVVAAAAVDGAKGQEPDGVQACPGIDQCHTRKEPLGDGRACSPKCYEPHGVMGTSK